MGSKKAGAASIRRRHDIATSEEVIGLQRHQAARYALRWFARTIIEATH